MQPGRTIRIYTALAKSYFGYVFKMTKPPMPCFFNIDPSSACNLRCVFCPQSDPPEGMHFSLMEFELFERIIEQIRESATCAGIALYLSGEPLLNKELARMIRLVNERLAVRPQIATNGVLLSPERSNELIGAGAGSFMIDFCADPDHFEAMCPPARWEQVRHNIAALGEMIRSKGLPITVHLKDLDWRGETPDQRKQSFEAMQNLFGDRAPYHYILYNLHNWAGEFSEKAEERYGYRRTADGSSLRYHACSHPWLQMSIHSDGNVSICCRDTMREEVAGNLRDNTLGEIWHGPRMMTVRELLANQEYKKIGICRNCDRLWTGSYSGGGAFRIAATFVRKKIRQILKA